MNKQHLLFRIKVDICEVDKNIIQNHNIAFVEHVRIIHLFGMLF